MFASILKIDPYREPAGSSHGGEFAKNPNATDFASMTDAQYEAHLHREVLRGQLASSLSRSVSNGLQLGRTDATLKSYKQAMDAAKEHFSADELAGIVAHAKHVHTQALKDIANAPDKDLLKATEKDYVNLTDAEKEGLYNYTKESATYSSLAKKETKDGVLLSESGYVPDEQNFPKLMHSLDSAMTKMSAPQPMTVYRGLSSSMALGSKLIESMDNARNGVGGIFKDDGYSSTSTDKKVAESYRQDDGVILKISIPKGTPGCYIGSDSRRSEGSHLDEFVLPRGSMFNILKVEKIDGVLVFHAILHKEVSYLHYRGRRFA